MRTVFTIAFLSVFAGACFDSGRTVERPARYQEEFLLSVLVAPGAESSVQLEFPAGYNIAEEAPNKVIAHPELKHTRKGRKVHFHDTVDGENAYIDVYYCEKEVAAICAFRPVEIIFDADAPTTLAQVKIPEP